MRTSEEIPRIMNFCGILKLIWTNYTMTSQIKYDILQLYTFPYTILNFKVVSLNKAQVNKGIMSLLALRKWHNSISYQQPISVQNLT